MGRSLTLTLPGWVGTADEIVDEAWDVLRGRPPVDRVFYAASAVGDFSVIWHLINAARWLGPNRDSRRTVRFALALGAESILVNQVIKRAFRRERPVLDRDRPHALRQPSTSSFPSGHASSATMAALLLSKGNAFAPAYRTAAVLVATSRLHVRIHHASDVVAGALVGAACAKLFRRYL